MTAADIMISTTSSKLYAFCEAVPTAKHVPDQVPVGYFAALSEPLSLYPSRVLQSNPVVTPPSMLVPISSKMLTTMNEITRGTIIPVSAMLFRKVSRLHNNFVLLLQFGFFLRYVLQRNTRRIFFTLCVCVCVTKTFQSVYRTFCTFCVCVCEKSLCETLFTRMSELHRV